MTQRSAALDTIDLRDVAASILRGRRWIPLGVVVGLAAGVFANQLSHRYEAEATVVLQDRGSGGLGALGVSMMEGLPSSIGDALSLPSGFSGLAETEAAILQGQELLREVTRDLGLQLRIVRPRAVGNAAVFSRIVMEDAAPRGSFTFLRSGDAYEVKGNGGFRGSVAPGGSLLLPGGEIRLREDDSLPDRFTVRVASSWETIDAMRRRREVVVDNAGGALAEVAVRWTDPETAASIANTLVELYLRDRRSRIRGLSEERLRILGHVRDSLDSEVADAADELREFQSASGTFDPERLGDLERIAELRANVDLLEVEAGALDNVLQRVAGGEGVSQADLLAFPSFLESEAINEILLRLTALRDQRAQLLERRTLTDPDVLVLDRAIRNQEMELLELARSYRDGLEESLGQIEGRLTVYRGDLAERPSFESEGLLLENRLEVTGATFIAVQTQVVRSRLESVSEGAELRQVDRAVVPTRARFPRRKLNYALGAVAGSVVGLIAALLAGAVTSVVSDPKQVLGRLAVPVLTPGAEAPLPQGLIDGDVVVVPVPGSDSAEPACEFLRGFEVVSSDRIHRVSVAQVRSGDRVVLAMRVGEALLTRAEMLRSELEAAGASTIACVILPRRRRS
jgi:uncharacterized protein involved in exopolysaccharide biosynthesis